MRNMLIREQSFAVLKRAGEVSQLISSFEKLPAIFAYIIMVFPFDIKISLFGTTLKSWQWV